MPKCLVPNCENRYYIGGKKKRTKSFFRVPHGQNNQAKFDLAKIWLNFCQIDIATFVFKQHQSICEDHFEPHLIEIIQQKFFPHGFKGQMPKRIIAGSVPTLLPPPGVTPSTVCSIRPDPLPKKKKKKKSKKSKHSKLLKRMLLSAGDSSEICEKIRLQPKSIPRKEVADLARWPPNVQVCIKDLNALLTCGICDGYFYNATTITVCLHTFCKSCLVKHFYRSLLCPKCGIEVHPSDPFSCIKLDYTIQDLVEKIFPDYYKEEVAREIAFYKSKGLVPPQLRDEMDKTTSKSDQQPKMISIMLEYIGTSPHLPSHLPLVKKFLRVSDIVLVAHVQKFLTMKMSLPLSSQPVLFVNMAMLHGDLTLRRVQRIFGKQMEKEHEDVLVLQFGVIPKGDYFQEGLIIDTKDL